MLDTHAHLCDTVAFPPGDIPPLLARAAAAGVTAVIIVTESAADIPRTLELCSLPPQPPVPAADALAATGPPDANGSPAAAAAAAPPPPPSHGVRLLPAFGVHPETVSACATDAAADAAVAAAMDAAATAGATLGAIGEIGLDYTQRVLARGAAAGADADAVRRRQLRALHAQLDVAAALGLPATVHSRGAGRHVVAALAARAAATPPRPTAPVVLHAFDGRAVHAAAAVAAGAYLSIPPSVVREAAAGGGGAMRKWLPRVPLGRLLWESDAPALGPVAGERNEPANVVRAAEMVAALRGVPVAHVTAAVDATARRVCPRAFSSEAGGGSSA